MVGGDTVGPIGDGFEAVVPVIGVGDGFIIWVSDFCQSSVFIPFVFNGVAGCVRVAFHPVHVIEGAGEHGGAFGDGFGVAVVIITEGDGAHRIGLADDTAHAVMGEGGGLAGGFHEGGGFAEVVVGGRGGVAEGSAQGERLTVFIIGEGIAVAATVFKLGLFAEGVVRVGHGVGGGVGHGDLLAAFVVAVLGEDARGLS